MVTLALLLAFQGLAQTVWGIELRTLPGLWGNRSYSVLGFVITWDQTTTILAAVAVAFGFRALFRYTRFGVSMRAVVDNRELWFMCISNPDGFEYTFTPGNRPSSVSASARVDAIVASVQHISGTAEDIADVVHAAVANPLIKAIAFATGTGAAMRAARRKK